MTTFGADRRQAASSLAPADPQARCGHELAQVPAVALEVARRHLDLMLPGDARAPARASREQRARRSTRHPVGRGPGRRTSEPQPLGVDARRSRRVDAGPAGELDERPQQHGVRRAVIAASASRPCRGLTARSATSAAARGDAVRAGEFARRRFVAIGPRPGRRRPRASASPGATAADQRRGRVIAPARSWAAISVGQLCAAAC